MVTGNETRTHIFFSSHEEQRPSLGFVAKRPPGGGLFVESEMNDYTDLTREIKITQNRVAVIDVEDFNKISRHHWYENKGPRTSYARTTLKGVNRKGILMHRFILNAPKGMEVDHINGNGLDNRRSNLRLCTSGQNHYNALPQKNNTSGCKGVHYHKTRKTWNVAIKVNGKRLHLGCFKDKEDAVNARRKAEEKLNTFGAR